jgi:hypothetical protein
MRNFLVVSLLAIAAVLIIPALPLLVAALMLYREDKNAKPFFWW